MKAKNVLIGLALTLSTLPSYAAGIIDCEYNSITHLIEKMKTSGEFVSQNPFYNNCVPFIINVNEKPQLSLDDFQGQKALYKIYTDTFNNPESHVFPAYDAKNGKYYHFFRLNIEDEGYKRFKEIWSKQGNQMALHFDDFLALHELSHLSPELDPSRFNNSTEYETLTDISAVYLLSFQQQFTVKETLTFLESVRDLRRNDNRRGFTVNNKLVKDTKHFNNTIFFKAIRDLKSIKNQDEVFKLAEEYINIKEENIPEHIRKKYYK